MCDLASLADRQECRYGQGLFFECLLPCEEYPICLLRGCYFIDATMGFRGL